MDDVDLALEIEIPSRTRWGMSYSQLECGLRRASIHANFVNIQQLAGSCDVL